MVTRRELPYIGLRTIFSRIFWDFIHVKWKILFYTSEIEHMSGEYEMNSENSVDSEKSEFQFGYRWPLVTILDQLSSCQPSGMTTIHLHNESYHPQSQHRDLQQKPSTQSQSSTSTCCQPSLMRTITRNHRIGYCHSQKAKYQFWSIFNFNTLLALLARNHYQTQ